VAAVNAAGLSPQSGEASATPQVPSAAAFVQRVGSVTASASRARPRFRSARRVSLPVTRWW
jgi:hypothetical protein